MPADARPLNDAGLGLIITSEGFEPTPKPCPAGKPTVGHGHVVQAGESFPRPLTREEARDLLLRDLESAERAVERLVRVPLTDGQFAALASFTFNLGGGALADSTLLKKLNQGDYAGAADEFPRWDKARVMDPKSGHKIVTTLPGLAKRRAAERELFLTSDPQPEKEAGAREPFVPFPEKKKEGSMPSFLLPLLIGAACKAGSGIVGSLIGNLIPESWKGLGTHANANTKAFWKKMAEAAQEFAESTPHETTFGQVDDVAAEGFKSLLDRLGLLPDDSQEQPTAIQ